MLGDHGGSCETPGKAVAAVGPQVPGLCECPPKPKPFPELGPLPSPSFRLLLVQRLPEGNGLSEASPVTSTAEGEARVQMQEKEEEKEEEGTSV